MSGQESRRGAAWDGGGRRRGMPRSWCTSAPCFVAGTGGGGSAHSCCGAAGRAVIKAATVLLPRHLPGASPGILVTASTKVSEQ